MKSKASVKSILTKLDELYPWDGVCFLNYKEPWQLLFATILSAQCTDEQVNRVTADLFIRYPNLRAFAEASLSELEQAVRATGFFRMKALHIQQSARKLLNEHGGHLPREIEKLTALPGVGRKTANVVRGHIFREPSVVVDTHVARVSNRLGLTPHKDAVKIEFALMEILPRENWIPFNQQIITHGRKICAARSPKCAECGLALYCDSAKNTRREQ